MKKGVTTAFVVSILSGVVLADDATDRYHNWPQWRGPLATGESPTGNPAIEWSEIKNVRWKVRLPGRGKSTPVVWDDRIFLTTSIPLGRTLPEGERPVPTIDPRGQHPGVIHPDQIFAVEALAVNREDGDIVWRKRLREEFPHEGSHRDATLASGSVVTDGEHVYAYFGSRGIYCLDLEGNLKWEKDLGDLLKRRGFGEGSSPAIHDDKLIVLWDHQGQSFIVALDKRTGKELWRTDRDEVSSWTTPFVVEHAGTTQVVTNATERVRSYDVETGELIWESSGTTLVAIPSPVGGDGMVFVTAGYQGNDLKAIRLSSARGDVTETEAVAWRYDKDTPYVPSPLLYENTLYILKSNSGILTAFDSRVGDKLYGPLRLDGVMNVFASPVAAAGRIYIAGRDGNTLVLEHGPEYKVLALNGLDDGFDASPAISGEDLFLRGREYLYRVAEP